MPKMWVTSKEGITRQMRLRQELGLDSVVPSTHDWFQNEVDGLVEAISDRNKDRVDYIKKRIISAIDELESAHLETFELKRKLVEVENKVKDLAKTLGIHPGTNW